MYANVVSGGWGGGGEGEGARMKWWIGTQDLTNTRTDTTPVENRPTSQSHHLGNYLYIK